MLSVKHMRYSRFPILCGVIGSMAVGCKPQVPESQSRPSLQTGTLTESQALAVARQTLGIDSGTNWLGTNVFYTARRDGRGWEVKAKIIDETNAAGEEIGPVGGLRILSIDENGAVKVIMRGR
jgi:hypothetical protein